MAMAGRGGGGGGGGGRPAGRDAEEHARDDHDDLIAEIGDSPTRDRPLRSFQSDRGAATGAGRPPPIVAEAAAAFGRHLEHEVWCGGRPRRAASHHRAVVAPTTAGSDDRRRFRIRPSGPSSAKPPTDALRCGGSAALRRRAALEHAGCRRRPAPPLEPRHPADGCRESRSERRRPGLGSRPVEIAEHERSEVPAREARRPLRAARRAADRRPLPPPPLLRRSNLVADRRGVTAAAAAAEELARRWRRYTTRARSPGRQVLASRIAIGAASAGAPPSRARARPSLLGRPGRRRRRRGRGDRGAPPPPAAGRARAQIVLPAWPSPRPVSYHAAGAPSRSACACALLRRARSRRPVDARSARSLRARRGGRRLWS